MKLNWLPAIFLNFTIISAFLQGDQIEDAFQEIYNTGHWGINQEGRGTSGEGSTANNTIAYRDLLQSFLQSNNIKSVVDLGCGDWEFSQLIDWNGIDYLGIDVVTSIIAINQQKFSAPNINFIQGNIVNTDLPEADLLICKDVLQHLPNELIIDFLPQLSKFKHCLITNCVDSVTLSSNNPNIIPGHYRLLDLTKPPFNVKGEKILTYISGRTTKQVLYIQP